MKTAFPRRSRPSSLAGQPSRRTGPRRKMPAVVLAAGTALVLLLVAMLLQETLPRRSSVAEPMRPEDFARLLPSGATVSPSAPLEVPDLPQPSYVIGYVMGEDSHVAYARWDRSAKKYRITATAPLAAGSSQLHGQPELSLLALGPGTPVAVVARAAFGAASGASAANASTGDGVMVLVSRGDELTPAGKVEEDGTVSTAQFVSGASATHADSVAFEDVDADGDRDAIARGSVTDADGDEEKVARVFAWDGSAFRFDPDLSWTLTTSSRVFPEPQAEPSPESGAETEFMQ